MTDPERWDCFPVAGCIRTSDTVSGYCIWIFRPRLLAFKLGVAFYFASFNRWSFIFPKPNENPSVLSSFEQMEVFVGLSWASVSDGTLNPKSYPPKRPTYTNPCTSIKSLCVGGPPPCNSD